MNPLAIKALVGVVFAAVLFAAGYRAGGNSVERLWLQEKVAEEKQRAKDQLAAQGVSSAYQLRIRDLEDAARNRPTRVVRMCVDPVQVPGAPDGSYGAPEEGVSGTAGPDIGSRLDYLALDADRCAEQLSALQKWVKMVARTSR